MLNLAPQSQQPQLLYAQAVPYLNGTWLIVPVLEASERYSFFALDPEGQDWCNSQRPHIFKTTAHAITAGKAYIDLVLAEMQGEAA